MACCVRNLAPFLMCFSRLGTTRFITRYGIMFNLFLKLSPRPTAEVVGMAILVQRRSLGVMMHQSFPNSDRHWSSLLILLIETTPHA
jgi:hypothetical protein